MKEGVKYHSDEDDKIIEEKFRKSDMEFDPKDPWKGLHDN